MALFKAFCSRAFEMRKNVCQKPKIFYVGIVAAILTLLGGCSLGTTSDEPCDWCNKTPTKAYTMSDGSKSYVCANCRTECAWCGAKATKHYENLASMMVFVCNDCYQDVVN